MLTSILLGRKPPSIGKRAVAVTGLEKPIFLKKRFYKFQPTVALVAWSMNVSL